MGRAGLDTALLRFSATYAAAGDAEALKAVYLRAAGAVFSISLPVSAALYLFAGELAEALFRKPALAHYLETFSLVVFPYAMVMVNAECLRGLRKIKAYLFFEGMGINLFAALLLLVLLTNSRENALAPAFALSVAGLFAASTASWFRAAGLLSLRAGGGLSLRQMLRTSLPMLTANLLMKTMGWVDTLMLGVLRPAGDVGVYNIALKISMLTKLTLTAVNSVIAPQFAADHSRGDMDSFRRTSHQAARLIFWTSAPVLIALFLWPRALTGFFGPEFTAGATALVILTVGQFIASVSGSVGYILNMTGHQVIQQNVTLFSIVLNVVLNFVLIPPLGLAGAALAASAGLAFRNLVSVYFIHKKLHFVTLYNPFAKRRS
jgi:O-antigen/teichoic acid export membrane protein